LNGVILGLCLLLPVATAWHFNHPTPTGPGQMEIISVEQGPTALKPSLLQSPSIPLLVRLEASLQPHLPRLVALWALGASFMAVRLVGGMALSLRWKQQGLSAPVEWQQLVDRLARQMGLLRKVRLSLSTRGNTPMTMGLWRPVVLVPVALLANLPPDYLEALLAHELAHVRRLDYLSNLLQGVAEALLFFHPAIWWLSARIRAEREELADQLAAQSLGDPRRLALALNALDDFQPVFSRPFFPALAARGGHLLTRIERLLTPRPTAASHWGLLSLLLLPGAVFALRAAVPEQAPIPAPAALVAQVDALAAKEGLDPQLLRSIVWVESGYSPTAKSPMGATGLLQVMPETARAYGAKDLNDPAQVMEAGAKYLRFLLDRYQGDVKKAVTAYNCGEQALDEGRITPEAARYRALVLDVLSAKAVQPEAPLANGEVQGVLLHLGDTWLVHLRASTCGGLKLDFRSDEDSKNLGSMQSAERAPDGSYVVGSWQESRPKLTLMAPKAGTSLTIRGEDPGIGWKGETRVSMDASWKTFRFQMEKPKS
jgi:soluble lytic murein transglycosylase-like protein